MGCIAIVGKAYFALPFDKPLNLRHSAYCDALTASP
jgi:hypothetical protein